MKSAYKFLRLLPLLGGLLFSTYSAEAQCPNVVWGDEFDGNSLDLSKWNYQTGDGCAEGICGWGNSELQSYQESNVAVSGGRLQITAQKQRIRGSQYTSGRINSKGKGDFTYGRFEALIKLPAGDGLWPAFWMLSTNEPYGGWPQSGEIDIMEFTASRPDEIYGTIHYGDLYPGNQFQGNEFHLKDGSLFPDGFHEFAIEWEPGKINWFIDGILYSTKTTSDVSPFNWPFDQDFHFLLNVAVGGDLGGPVDNNALPATMEVEYVRVFDGFRPHIAGKHIVLNQAQGEVFEIGGLSPNANVTWTVPADATLAGGQGSSQATVDFGDTNGWVTATFDAGCGQQTLSIYVEVEPPFAKEFAFENFDDTPTAIFSSATGTLNEVGNPAPDATNGSALCGQYTRNSGEQYDLLIYNASIADASLYVDKSKKFYMDVYTDAPIGTDIILQLETAEASPTNYPTGRHSRYIATVTENNNWQRLIFQFLDRPDPGASDTGVNTMILLFASNSFTGDTYYYDNIDSYAVGTGGPGPSNQAPSVSISSPADGAEFTANTSISITASASDSDGTVSQVEFFADGNSIGVDNSAPYSVNWTVPAGGTALTAVATDDQGASTTSAAVNVTGTSAGDPSSVLVASVATGTAGAGQGFKYGTATITVQDDLGGAAAGATVTATFSGTYSEQVTGTTGADGTVTLQTAAKFKGSVVVNACVDDVVHSLPYDAASNVMTCNASGARIAPQATSEDLNLTVYPNPAKGRVWVSFNHDGTAALVTLTDLTGRTVLQRELTGNNEGLDISALRQGMYFVRLQHPDGRTATVRLMK